LANVHEINALIFSHFDRATQLTVTRVNRGWRVLTITEKQWEQESRVNKVLKFLRAELQAKYPNVVCECEKCLEADPIIAISLKKIDESTSNLCSAFAEQLQMVDSAELMRLQGIFQTREDKPFGFESLFFEARKLRINLQGVNARQGHDQRIPDAVSQQMTADYRQLGLEAMPCFERLLKQGRIAEAAVFVRCIPFNQGGEEAFQKLDQARNVQVEELIKNGKFEEAITSANQVNNSGNCYKLLGKIGIAAAFVGDFKAVERVLRTLPDEYNQNETGKEIYQALVERKAFGEAEKFKELHNSINPCFPLMAR
jgi:hypothetical protein